MTRRSASDALGRSRWIPLFFAVAACSWMPHWACHYYRLETHSSFVVGAWEFSRADSALSMLAYSALIALDLASVVLAVTRPVAALLSGIGHSTIGALHVLRLARPFRFEVFDHAWSREASAREVAIVVGFGILCFVMAWITRPGRAPEGLRGRGD